MGFVSEELNETEKQLIKGGKASNMAVVYGKEASIWKVSPAERKHQPSAPRGSRPQDSAPIRRPQHRTTVENSPHQWVRKEASNCLWKYQPGDSCLTPLPAPTLCNKFKWLNLPPSLRWINRHSHPAKGV